MTIPELFAYRMKGYGGYFGPIELFVIARTADEARKLAIREYPGRPDLKWLSEGRYVIDKSRVIHLH